MNPTLREIFRLLRIPAYVFLGLIFIAFIPMLFVCMLGWRLTEKIRDKTSRVALRSLLATVTMAPTWYGHAGPVPAIAFYLLLGDSPEEKRAYGLVPLVIFLPIAVIATFLIDRYSARRSEKKEEGGQTQGDGSLTSRSG